MRKRHEGFTLAEMLIVIAIIAILAALLLPALSGVRERGRQARCASNLHQMQIAAVNYAGGGRLPAATNFVWLDSYGMYHLVRGWVAWQDWSPRTEGPTNVNIAMTVGFGYAWEGNPGITCITNGTLYEYLGKELSVYLCPTFAQRRVSGSSNPVRSYSMNLALHWINVFDANYRPSQTILFGDEALSNSPVDKADSAFFADTQFGGYHGNGWGNVVYADGHVDRRR